MNDQIAYEVWACNIGGRPNDWKPPKAIFIRLIMQVLEY